MRLSHQIAFAAIASLSLASGPAAKAANLVQNGGFEQTTSPTSAVISGNTTLITGWQNNATYTLLIFPGDGDKTNSGLGGFALYGPNNGVANGLPATSPNGGNYIGLDGDTSFRGTGLTQTINGLVSGQQYLLTFYLAGGQEVNAAGATTEQIAVSLGAQTQDTEVLNTPYQGFSPWRLESFTFTASAATEVLRFLGVGTPSAEPPIVLIDGVSLTTAGPTPVPEPATWALVLAGVAGVVGARRWRRQA